MKKNDNQDGSSDNGRRVSRKFNGKRIRQLDNIKAPKPWVVDGIRGDEFWSKVKRFAIPLKVKRGIFPAIRKEQSYTKNMQEKYGNNVFMVLIPDEECLEGWSARFVIPDDLNKNLTELLDEGSEASKNGDFVLSDMKRHAAMIVSGWVDTK